MNIWYDILGVAANCSPESFFIFNDSPSIPISKCYTLCNYRLCFRLIQETNRFQPLYDTWDETNERKQDFHDSVTEEYMAFRHITASGERGRLWDQQTKPSDVYIIPMSMFRALFNQEWTSFHLEDTKSR